MNTVGHLPTTKPQALASPKTAYAWANEQPRQRSG
jgi:hypothetical protein